MYTYLNDKQFLYELDKIKIKTTHIHIQILDFVTERPLQAVQGIALSGSINVNVSSSVRRTMNITFYADDMINDITNTENLLSLKTKIKVEIGLDNPLKSYAHYGKIIWFPQGMFVCTNVQFSRSSNGCTIAVQGRDKMVLLDGSLGGVIPASTSFHEIYTYDEDENIWKSTPTMRQIIQEAVHHIGNQPAEKIIITDLSDEVKMLVKYRGDTPIWFNNEYNSFVINNQKPSSWQNVHKFSRDDDVGYMMTDFVYPGDLTLNVGATVVDLLKKITSVLGNYEFFFDLDGNFVFQEIKNYLNISYTPIVNLEESSYIKNFSDSKYAYSLTDDETVLSFQRSPKCSDVKNDFIVWGARNSTADSTVDIRYHLAVDVKPQIDLAGQYMWGFVQNKEPLRYEYTPYHSIPLYDGPETLKYTYPSGKEVVFSRNMAVIARAVRITSVMVNGRNELAVIGRQIERIIGGRPSVPYELIEVEYIDADNRSFGYIYFYQNGNWNRLQLFNSIKRDVGEEGIIVQFLGNPCQEWREELYRQALEKRLTGTAELFYDEEILAEWRKLFDTTNATWKSIWDATFPKQAGQHDGLYEGSTWLGWNPRVFTDPASLDYWLDFIDSTDALAQYSVNVIGRRTKAVNDKDVKSIYNIEVPDVVFIENTGDKDEVMEKMDKYVQQGQDFCLLLPNQMSYFSTSTTPKSAYEAIREMVYQNLTYNSSITINCQPKYYLQPNNLIHIEDQKSGISGNFIITSFTIPLAYSGTMSLVASEALTRV